MLSNGALTIASVGQGKARKKLSLGKENSPPNPALLEEENLMSVTVEKTQTRTKISSANPNNYTRKSGRAKFKVCAVCPCEFDGNGVIHVRMHVRC